ncbi:MAG: D-amino-acid dehydrogenase [Ferruginibacter sp.]|uniref:NAD(P)/FAD-dependent oxidoreductase n=1 Tax=Ferruginibacter sp. TaxID=1940288 RepID=UPI00265B1D7D|nr:FAD-dependent oxidoreductase [Ferruginibacter sp.]MDB5280101.1 D-amino-acid dehydrogenase [Ferruginibacter sp.]
MKDITIIGGGIIGLCSAYYLQKEGYKVNLIERGDLSDGCSFGNMGYISPSHFVPLASPGIISQGLKWMLSSTSPFYIKPRLNLDLMRWGYHFRKSSTAEMVQQNGPHLIDILQVSRRLMFDLKNDIGDTFEMEDKGCLMMCRQQKTLDHEFHLADEAEKYGLKVERLSRQGVQQLEPDVELDVAGAVLFKDDCHLNPGKLMIALKSHLEKSGVVFHLNTTVTGFEKANNAITTIITDKGAFHCSELVLATGSWLPVVAKMMGIRLLLQPGKGYSHTYEQVENNVRYPAILVDGRCAITPWGQQLRIGGTMEISGINNNVLVSRMQGVYDSAKRFYPGLKIDFPPTDKIWHGLRPVTPDGMPYIDRTEQYNNVIIAGGHAMLGISEATGTGKLVTDLIQHKTSDIDVSAFRLNRF